MRQAGILPNEQDAARLAAYLTTLSIRTRVDTSGGQSTIWIYEENELDRSKQEFDQFVQDPHHPRYAGAEQRANEILRAAQAQDRQRASKVVDLRSRWERPLVRRCPVTIALIAASVASALFTDFSKSPVTNYLLIAPVRVVQDDSWGEKGDRTGLTSVRAGEVWRLVTPIFLHYNLWHLLFNMIWLIDLGRIIESRRGSLRFALLVLVAAVASNVGQYLYAGPMFGGMSGVVYALFGYVWMKSRFDPGSGMYLQPNTVFLMIGFFFLCFTGLFGPIANAAHGVGLAVGMLIGYLPARFTK